MAVLMALLVILGIVIVVSVFSALFAFAIAMIVIVFAVVAVVVVYALDAAVKYKLFRLFGVASPVCAFVPFYSNYLLGHMCSGRDGYFDGVFGFAVPNIVMEIGWLYMFISYGGASSMRLLPFMSRESAESIFAGMILLLGILYWSNIWAFVFSRLEGRSVDSVTGLAIASSIVGVIAIFKVLTLHVDQVYSLDNDVYPLEYDNTEG